jgi:hypothetical protein
MLSDGLRAVKEPIRHFFDHGAANIADAVGFVSDTTAHQHLPCQRYYA